MPSLKRFLVVRVFPVAVLLAGAGAAYVGIESMTLARSSNEWPSVNGTITRSGIERETRTSGTSRSTTYRARVLYEYRVDGTAHSGDRISYGHYDTEKESDAANVVARYPAGRPARVYYQPGNPVESVLEPGSGGVPWLLAALGLVFALVGTALAVVLPKFADRLQ
jgi:hypothetical protein